MAYLTEFYLTTLWDYKPKTIKEVLDGLLDRQFDNAEFIFDHEYGWLKVTCREEDEDEIRQEFAAITSEIEDRAFDSYEDSILSLDDTLKSSFDNEWFSHGAKSSSHPEFEELDRSPCGPETLPDFPHTAVWDDLDKNNEPYKVQDIATGEQLERIKRETNVDLSISLAGRLVDVRGHSKEAIRRAKEKLGVLVAIKKFSDEPVRAQHLLYAEGYVDPFEELYTDLRYLANIDAKLVSSTLLDRSTLKNPTEAYRRMYQEGASIRLCSWDPVTRCRISLLGPKVTARPRDRTALGNRPEFCTRNIHKLSVVAEEIGVPDQHQGNGFGSQVETWIQKLPMDADAATGSSAMVLAAQAPRQSAVETTDENLIDLSDEQHPTRHNQPFASQSNTVTEKQDLLAADTSNVSVLCKDFSAALSAHSGMSSKGKEADVQQPTRASPDLDFTGDDCLIDMLDAVETVGHGMALSSNIDWEMPSLVPNATDEVGSVDNVADFDIVSSAASECSTGVNGQRVRAQQHAEDVGINTVSCFRRHLQSGTDEFKPSTDQGPLDQPKSLAVGDLYRLTRADLESPSTRPQPRDRTRCVATHDFIDEIETAVGNLLSSGPYRRGQLAVRAELGRVIFKGVDPSGLAFNDAKTPSNGWRKADLLIRLHTYFASDQRVHFTKVLTSYAYDVEDMINTKTSETRLWQEKPSRAWTTYSFDCSLSSAGDLGRFIVDIEDAGNLSQVLSYSVRPHNNALKERQPSPIYVHAVQRHWDVQIVMSHINPDGLDETYGSFARTLLQSLSISRNQKGAPEIKFALHNDFAVDVNEVRVLTKWRHPSLDNESDLEITEVEVLSIVPYSDEIYSGDGWDARLARPCSKRAAQQLRAQGQLFRWYEAAVVSRELEALCRENAALGLGDKAGWDVRDLQARGALAALYGPALQMVAEMDHVGRNDDNHMAREYAHLLLRPNDGAPRMPGSLSFPSAPGRAGTAQGPQARGGPGGSGAISGARLWTSADSTAPTWAENNPSVQFW